MRNQFFVNFDGPDTVAGIRGASLLKGKQHADNTLVADHRKGGCQCREVFKSVLDDESRGVFQGKIIVRQHAQKTDAKHPYSAEKTGMTLIPVREFPNYVSTTPTSCQMKRP